jgi:protein-disulfide isomerase
LPDEFRYVFRHFPILPKHKYAQLAAEASEAAAVQGRFWEYHDVLFNHQPALKEADLTRYSVEPGPDPDRLRHQLTAREFEAKVKADHRGGEESGVSGTPTFFINGTIYDGHYEYRPLYEALIKEIRAKN